MHYRVVIEQDEDGIYVAECPSLPGCISQGKTRDEATKLLDKFHDLLTTDAPMGKDMGKLVVFGGVREYPARVKCATLAWHTLKAALNNVEETASTE